MQKALIIQRLQNSKYYNVKNVFIKTKEYGFICIKYEITDPSTKHMGKDEGK